MAGCIASAEDFSLCAGRPPPSAGFFAGAFLCQCGSALRPRKFRGLPTPFAHPPGKRFVVTDSECVVGAVQSGDRVFFISGGARFTREFADGGDFFDRRGGDQFHVERAICGEDAGIVLETIRCICPRSYAPLKIAWFVIADALRHFAQASSRVPALLEATCGLCMRPHFVGLRPGGFQRAITAGSASVVVSPRTRPSAMSRNRRRMIFPLRVLGSSEVKKISSGRAMPSSLVTTCY